MVDIFFDKLYRYPRINECVSIAVPFAKGELYNTDNISIVQNKRKCIIQPKVTAEYDDGSIKYLFVDFMADLPANKLAKAVLTTTKQELANLIADGQSECAKHDGIVSVTPVNNGFLIKCGILEDRPSTQRGGCRAQGRRTGAMEKGLWLSSALDS